MPLYVLGFMGMTRRVSQNIDPEFHGWLVVAACGAGLIALGVLCQVIQIVVSIRDREKNRDLTGDPWGGRTLEWSTSSPPLLQLRHRAEDQGAGCVLGGQAGRFRLSAAQAL